LTATLRCAGQSAAILPAWRNAHAAYLHKNEFVSVVPGDTRVADAHKICDRIEEALKADMDGAALITIHVEPEAKAKISGVPVL